MTIEFIPQVEEKPLDRAPGGALRPGSLTLLRSDVRSRRMGEKARAGDGVIAGAGPRRRPPRLLLRAGPVVPRRFAGRAARRLDRACCGSRRAGAPVVGFIESGGARMQEGLGARRLRADLQGARRAVGQIRRSR